jgi:hypothetical protein
MKNDLNAVLPDQGFFAPSAQDDLFLLAPINPSRIAEVTLECRTHFDNTPREKKIESAERAARWVEALLSPGRRSAG